MSKITATIFESIHESGIEELKKFASVNMKLSSSLEEVKREAATSDVIIVKSVTKVNKEVLDACPNLKIVARAGVGLDNVDLPAATKNGKFAKMTEFWPGNLKMAVLGASLIFPILPIME